MADHLLTFIPSGEQFSPVKKTATMKSKVRFDLNEDSRAIIFAEFENTDDVRDKIAMRFRENLGHDSNIAVCRCIEESPSSGTTYNPGYKRMEIKTVRMEEYVDSLTEDGINYWLGFLEQRSKAIKAHSGQNS